MNIDEGSRDIILAIDSNGGTATTTEVRRATGLGNSSVRYRFGKLEDRGLIETEHDPDRTPDGVAPVTVASLTDLARKEIQKGLTVEAEQKRASIEPADNAERIEKVEQKLATRDEEAADLRNQIDYLRACVHVHRLYLAGWEQLPDYDALKGEAIESFREKRAE